MKTCKKIRKCLGGSLQHPLKSQSFSEGRTFSSLKILQLGVMMIESPLYLNHEN